MKTKSLLKKKTVKKVLYKEKNNNSSKPGGMRGLILSAATREWFINLVWFFIVFTIKNDLIYSAVAKDFR